MVVKSQEAFAANYPVNSIVIAPGVYSGNFSNSGEEITLSANGGAPIQFFTYFADGTVGWPSAADGLGFTMTLINPLDNPDPAIGASWKASNSTGGSPGIGDAKPLPKNPSEDLDNDGLNALAEYFFGTSDNKADLNLASIQTVNGEVLFSYPFDPDASAAQAIIELSDDLITWEADPASFTTIGDTGGIEILKIDESSLKRFIRVRVIQTP